jgi:endonuclease/exonuclease/phosphatase (EEP) superfamily protein YafD
MQIAFMVATVVLAALTLLPLSHHEAWWVRGLDFPRLQLTMILLLLLVLETVLLDLSRPSSWALLTVGWLCLIYQAWWIIPYSPLFPREIRSTRHTEREQTLSIIIANVKTENRNAAGLLELVRENAPDILVSLESDVWWQGRLDVLERDYPHTIKCPLDNRYGMHVYSRLPLADARVEYLVEPDKPSMHALVQLRSGHRVRAHFLHPAPPSPTENPESSERDAELVIVGQSVADADTPVIVTGDLNDVAWSRTTRLFRKVSGLLDPRVGRGMYNTFDARRWYLRWPLDHLFISHHFTLCRMRRLGFFGSDHFPIFAEVAYEGGGTGQRGLEADAQDLAAAQAKAEDERADARDVPDLRKAASPFGGRLRSSAPGCVAGAQHAL